MRARLALPLIWCSPAMAQVVAVDLHKPDRDFGRFVGDVLTSTAVITVMPGTVLDLRSLPPIGPASPVADVRRVEVGGTAERIEIRVTWQEYVSPDQVVQAEIPGYSIAFSAHGTRVTASVPDFAFTASPFRHDLQPTLDPAAMQPDHAPMTAQAPNARRGVAAGLILVAAGLLALFRPWATASRRGPFAAAAAGLPPEFAGQDDDAGRDILRALHRAFDATACRHVFADDIDDFLQRHPRFLPLRARITLFFAASRIAFFGDTAAPADANTWSALCRDLARAERRG